MIVEPYDMHRMDDLYLALETATSLTKRITILRNHRMDLRMDRAPELLLGSFDNIELVDQAMHIAVLFKNKFGTIAICREATCAGGEPRTLLDELQYVVNSNHDAELLCEAFIGIGFRYARECSDIELYHEYCLDPLYSKNAASDLPVLYQSYMEDIKRRTQNSESNKPEYERAVLSISQLHCHDARIKKLESALVDASERIKVLEIALKIKNDPST